MLYNVDLKNLLKTGIWAFHFPTRKITVTPLPNLVALEGYIKVQEENVDTSIHSFLLCKIWYLLKNMTYLQVIEYNNEINACNLTYILVHHENCLIYLHFHLSLPLASTDLSSQADFYFSLLPYF